jgi:hypothetical protein
MCTGIADATRRFSAGLTSSADRLSLSPSNT